MTHFVIDNSDSMMRFYDVWENNMEVGKKKLQTTLNHPRVTTNQLLILSWTW